MIDPQQFYQNLQQNDINFFTGVPDSLLKSLCSVIQQKSSQQNHIIAANEGAAIGLAIGHHLATGKIPCVYLQNSGLGNATNPLLSLADPHIYSIPLLLLIGWRGEPGTEDEPQHQQQGRRTENLLQAMEIPYEIIDKKTKTITLLNKVLGIARQKKNQSLFSSKKTHSQKFPT